VMNINREDCGRNFESRKQRRTKKPVSRWPVAGTSVYMLTSVSAFRQTKDGSSLKSS
jgi:hypothetical protein